MTLEAVQNRLDKLLANETPRVVLLTGDWGAGKTFQWKQALERAAKKGNRPRYAYVSLFGLGSLAEVRKRITEECVSAIKLPDRGETVGELVEGGAIGLKPMQLLKILPVIPYLSRLESLAQELSFSIVRNAVICFDDLERAPDSLRISDVFGLASYLREERKCRVLLISNQKKLSPDARKGFSTFLEKAVEETVEFAPTASEACLIALGPMPSVARQKLADRMLRLGLSNIRVISRLGLLADELSVIVGGLHPSLLDDLVNTLALFGVAHFIPNESFPSAEYLLGYGHRNLVKYFEREKKSGEFTDQERRESEWDSLISSYGYAETSLLDREVYRGIVSGYFSEHDVRALAEEQSRRIEDGNRKEALNVASFQFWWGVEESAVAFRNLLNAARAALNVVNASEIYDVYRAVREIDGEEAAMNLLKEFIEANQHRRDALVPSSHFGEKFEDVFKATLEAEFTRLAEPLDLAKAIDAIDFRRGWNPEDLEKIARVDFDDVLKLLKGTKDARRFADRLTTLLKFAERGETVEARKVGDSTRAWLKTVAQKDPISAVRMGRFLPAEESPATATPSTPR